MMPQLVTAAGFTRMLGSELCTAVVVDRSRSRGFACIYAGFARPMEPTAFELKGRSMRRENAIHGEASRLLFGGSAFVRSAALLAHGP